MTSCWLRMTTAFAILAATPYAAPVHAQDKANQPPAEQIKTSADIPGFPSGTVITPATAAILAQDTYLWGWALVDAFNRRASFAAAPEPGLVGGILPTAPVGYIAMLSDYISPDQRWVAHPNQDVVYGFGYAAVDDGPVVLQIPDFGDRFWVWALYDARSDEFSRLGEPYGTKPGNYLVVGPHWQGKIPEGITEVIRAPTELVAMGPRAFMNDTKEDRQAVQATLNGLDAYPLSRYTGERKNMNWKALPHFAAGAKTAGETKWVDPNKFFDQLPEVLAKVPPLPGEESRYAMMKALLEAGKNPEIKAAMVRAAVQTENNVISPLFDFRTNGSALPGGWNTPTNGARWGYDYITRTATAKSNMYVNQPEETRYFFIEVDGKGQRLDGGKRYMLTFAKDKIPPANGFWSLTMYDQQHFFSPNNLKRYSLGTKNSKHMKFNDDGSLTLYIQHDSPGADKATNWLPAPKGPFEMTIRTYGPKPEVLNGQWMPPAVQRVGD